MPRGGSTTVVRLPGPHTRSARPRDCRFLSAGSASHTTPAIAGSVRIRVGPDRPVDGSIPTRRSRREDRVSGVQRAGHRGHRRVLRLRRLRTAHPRRTGDLVGRPVAPPWGAFTRATLPCGPSELPHLRERPCRRARRSRSSPVLGSRSAGHRSSVRTRSPAVVFNQEGVAHFGGDDGASERPLPLAERADVRTNENS